jgi:hypothetical protein
MYTSEVGTVQYEETNDSCTVCKVTQYLLVSSGVYNFVRNSGSTDIWLPLSQLKPKTIFIAIAFQVIFIVRYK